MAYQSQTPYVPHKIAKVEKIVQTAVGIIERESVLPRLFNHQGMSDYMGALGDSVTVRFGGALPYRRYAFRNDRTDPIIFDSLAESSTKVTLGDHIYSATRLTDEQRDFDQMTINGLIPTQAKAVVQGLNNIAVKALNDQQYTYTIGGASGNLLGAILEMRRLMNLLGLPDNRTLLVGANVEIALLQLPEIARAQNAGDTIAADALSNARIARVYGFDIVTDPTIDPDSAYAFVDSAFTLYTAAPSVPRGVIQGGTFSGGGFSLRWMHDYETTRMMERSVVDVWCGVGAGMDRLVYPAKDFGQTPVVATQDSFIRALKMTLGGTSAYPAAGSDVANYTGVDATKAWKAA